MQDISLHHISLDKLSLPEFIQNGVEAAVLRLDKIHPLISGNKWFKLRYYIDEAKQQGKKTIVTFGGAWSNHIPATAAMCRLHGLRSTGIIRGEEGPALSATLQLAKEMEMEIIFISREAYRAKKIPPGIPADAYLVEQGGYGMKGAAGAATILDHCPQENYTHICCAAGTGTMAAGISKSADAAAGILAVNTMKNNPGIEKDIHALSGGRPVTVLHDYHFGGYAKYQPALIRFMNDFYDRTSVPSDFVYTGKLFYAITDLVQKKYFPPGSRLLLIHSGGLQGNASLGKGTLIF